MSEQKAEFSSVPDGLRETYRSTHYNVLEPAPFTLRIGKPSQDLASLYRDHDVSSAAFLTAWNPYSEPAEQHENELAQSKLERRLAGCALRMLRGIGTDVSGLWPGEPSVLALGVSRDRASRLGNEFRQNAIVWIGADHIPELVFLR